MAQETQDFINEVETSSFYTHAQRVTMLKALSAALRENGQQLAKLRGLVQDAEMTEADDSLRGRYESFVQVLGAMQRQQEKIADEGRRLYRASEDLKRQYVEFRTEASASGYTIP